ncbi:MAG TPA: GtrA family protein [Gallionellaceae bacterium]|nr:GtrA family protein [Gallionellaceae bacterium]
MIQRMQATARAVLHRVLTPRFVKFGMVGASGVLVNQGVLYLAQTHVLHASRVHTGEDWLRLNLALAVAIFLATLNNFIWNRAWTWADRKHYEKGLFAQFGQYVLACWLAIVLQMLLTNLLAHHMEILVANLISIVLTSVLNFLINDIWTFGRRGCMNCINER